MKPAVVAAAVVVALAVTHVASAQVGEPAMTPSDEPVAVPPPLPPEPPEPPEVSPPESPPPGPRPSHSVARLSLVGGYRGLFDLDAFGGGVALSYGGDRPVSGHFNLRLLGGRTLGGLGIFEAAPSGTVEFALGDGFRFGLGAGISLFTINRATNGNLIMSCGPTGLARVAYDFAPHQAMFLLADVDAEWQAGALVWGPTLAVGYRF